MKKMFIIFLLLFIGCINDTALEELKNELQYVEVSYNPPTTQNPPVTMPEKPVISLTPGNQQIKIEWPDCLNTNKYDLYISTVSGVYNQIPDVAGVVSPLTLTGLSNDVKYFITISANNQNGKTMSDEKAAFTGIVDNLNGTVSLITDNLTFSKCSQKNINGLDTYNPLNNDCSNGLKTTFQYCDNPYTCDNGTELVGGNSEVLQTCSARGVNWRVPTANELGILSYYYDKNSDMWPDILGEYWPTNGYNTQPYGGYVWINVVNNTYTIAPINGTNLSKHVICVK